MTNLDDYLRGREDRCSVCGWHPEAQGHNPDVLHTVAEAPTLRRLPPDPITASERPDVLLGVLGEPIVLDDAGEALHDEAMDRLAEGLDLPREVLPERKTPRPW